MPYISEWVPNELFLEHNGVRIFHTYRNDEGEIRKYNFGTASDTTDEYDDTNFYVRDLPAWREPDHPPYINHSLDSEDVIASKEEVWAKYYNAKVEETAIRRAIIAAIDGGYLKDRIDAAQDRPKDLASDELVDGKPTDLANLPISDRDTVPEAAPPETCRHCKHWRDKAWTNRGWGICDNPKNEVKVSGLSRIPYFVDDPQAQKELMVELENGIRYPEDFGCIFFGPIDVTGI